MGRRSFTDNEKNISRIQRNARNKLWQLANKEKFDAYMKSYYQINKEKLNAKRCTNRRLQKQRERQQLITTNIVDI